uniref:Phosphatidylinositol transfer protein N-terminal domain-containing protein n=1 Tax=Anopheles maculatus TaxID=74869 RepID=A0A182T147_9DIPT
MVLVKEYRICMPLTVEEYKIGQLYMIARHSLEQSDDGEGVEVIENKECFDPDHGKGQYTEKRIHLSSRLPYWLQAVCPKVFYVIEKGWNYYPYTVTEYTCLNLSEEALKTRIVDHVDIAFEEPTEKHYKKEEDPKFFKSRITGRGPLVEGWRQTDKPMMCSYKLVEASFEVWGLQTRVEDFIQKVLGNRCIRDVLLLGHRQAFAWIDEWHGMSIDDVRMYEKDKQMEANDKLRQSLPPALETDKTQENN